MNDNFWTVFLDTGDPICYLLWKGSERDRLKECSQDQLFVGAE